MDIALAVRMIMDARHAHYEVCHLYTSDVDFIPVVRALKELGKRVCIFGYKDGLGKNSDMLHVPTQFVDLTETLRDNCELLPLPLSDDTGGANG